MPTARPSIAPSVVAKSGMVIQLLNRATRLEPTPTPNRAMPMGNPMASTEPNARMSTMMAKPRPMSSDDGGSNLASIAPPISTVSPSTVGTRALISVPTSAMPC